MPIGFIPQVAIYLSCSGLAPLTRPEPATTRVREEGQGRYIVSRIEPMPMGLFAPACSVVHGQREAHMQDQ